MANVDYLEKAATFFRSSQRTFLRAVPIALAAATMAHAAVNFGPPTIATAPFCSGGGTLTSNLTGVVGNSGQGLVLSGTASNARVGAFSTGGCMILQWAGSGSGSFDSSTLPALWDFTITPPGNMNVTQWRLTFNISDGETIATTTFSCSSNCSGTISGRDQTINVPSTLKSWDVELQVNFSWLSSAGGTLTVNVPAAASININVPLPPSSSAAPAPALSNLGLAVTALGLLALSVLWMARKRSSEAG